MPGVGVSSLVQQRAKQKQFVPGPYTVVNAPGGSFHVQPDGQKRFVPAGPPVVRDLMAKKPAPSPLDAQYFTDVAQQRFRAQQQLGQLGTQSAYARTDFDEALRRMGQQQGQDIQTTRENAAREGLFYSGQLGKREGDVNTQYARRTGDLRVNYDRGEAARQAARRALAAGASIDQAAAEAAAVDRQLDRDAQAAADGILARNPAPRRKAKAKPHPRRKVVRDLMAG
jgi:hypothetical protein